MKRLIAFATFLLALCGQAHAIEHLDYDTKIRGWLAFNIDFKGWEIVSVGRPEVPCIHMVDTLNISKKNYPIIKYWVRDECMEPQQSIPYRSVTVHNIGNCDDMASAVDAANTYSGNNLSNPISNETFSTDLKFVPFQPGSIGHAVLSAVCKASLAKPQPKGTAE